MLLCRQNCITMREHCAAYFLPDVCKVTWQLLRSGEREGRGFKTPLRFIFFLLLQLSLSPLFLPQLLILLYSCDCDYEGIFLLQEQTKGLDGWTTHADGADDVKARSQWHGGASLASPPLRRFEDFLFLWSLFFFIFLHECE